MSIEDDVLANRILLNDLISNSKDIDGLPSLATNVNLQDKIAMRKASDGQTVKTTIEQLIGGGVGTSSIRHELMLPFDFVKNKKNIVNGIHGSFLINNSEDGIVLNSGTPITGDGGVSKVLAAVLSGTVLSGSFTITGTSINRDTGVKIVGDSEVVLVDGLSINNTTTDANGNTVYDYSNTYISAKWWEGNLTFSTTDLNLTEVRFAQIAFEQFNDSSDITIETFDATYITEHVDAEMDAYLYAVVVDDNKRCTVKVISELHHEQGLLADNSFRRRKGNIAEPIDGTTSGVFIDLHLLPDTKEYFTSFVMKVWASKTQTINVVVDGSLGLDSITYVENLQPGDLVYLKNDGKYWKADNTAEATSTTELRLILEAGILDDSKLALAKGQYTRTSIAFTAGNEYVGVNGSITSTRPTSATETVRIVSTAIDTNTRYFDASKTWINGTASKINGVTIEGASNDFLDNVFTIINSIDQTRKLKFNLDSITSGTTRTASVQDKDGIIAYLSDITSGGGGTILEYSTKLQQAGTNVFEYLAYDTISGGDFFVDPTDFRDVTFSRIGIGIFNLELRYTSATYPTDKKKVSLMFGDGSVRVTNRVEGSTGTYNTYNWTFETYNTSGVLTDDLLIGQDGADLSLKIYP